MSKDKSGRTIADVLGEYLAIQCEVLLSINAELESALDAAKGSESPAIDEDQVHDARVACRRLRSVCRVFADVLEAPEAGRLSEDTKWYGLGLGAIRDLDVLRDRLASALDELDTDLVLHDAGAELSHQCDYRRWIATAELRDAIHSETYAELTLQLRRWKSGPPWTPEAEVPASKIKKYLKRADSKVSKRLQRAAAAIGSDDPEADELIHSARKAGKRHRYAVEAATSLLGSAADTIVAERKELQDLLGDYQDSRLASKFLRDLGGIPGRNGFTFGILFAAEADHRRRLRKRIAKRGRNGEPSHSSSAG